MNSLLNSLLPICFIIGIGYGLKHIKFPSSDFWPKMDKFTYYILMPCLLIKELSTARLEFATASSLITTSLGGILFILAILILLNLVINFERKAFTSIVQGGIRFNTYVFLALSQALYFTDGLVLAAIVIAFAIPFLNIICITIFAIYTNSDKFSMYHLSKNIIKNPLIIACVIGAFLNIVGNPLPIFITKSFSIISNATLPIGLLSVGFGLEIKHLKYAKKELIVSVVAKLILFPFIAYYLGHYLGLSDISLSIAILFAAMPTSTSAHILARELGGDITLMTSITTIETLACIGTLFVILSIL